jgi:adenylate cyclase
MPSTREIKASDTDPTRTRVFARELSDCPEEVLERHDTFFPCARGRLKLRRFSPTAGELIFYCRADVVEAGASRPSPERPRTGDDLDHHHP